MEIRSINQNTLHRTGVMEYRTGVMEYSTRGMEYSTRGMELGRYWQLRRRVDFSEFVNIKPGFSNLSFSIILHPKALKISMPQLSTPSCPTTKHKSLDASTLNT